MSQENIPNKRKRDDDDEKSVKWPAEFLEDAHISLVIQHARKLYWEHDQKDTKEQVKWLTEWIEEQIKEKKFRQGILEAAAEGKNTFFVPFAEDFHEHYPMRQMFVDNALPEIANQKGLGKIYSTVHLLSDGSISRYSPCAHIHNCTCKPTVPGLRFTW